MRMCIDPRFGLSSAPAPATPATARRVAMPGPDPGPGPSPDDPSYYPTQSGYLPYFYPPPAPVPPPNPVASAVTAAAGPAHVSPPDLSRHVSLASHYNGPQRGGTVTSGGGKFSVSPPSSVHEEDDEDAYGYGEVGREIGEGARGGLSPSPAQHQHQYQHAAQGGWRGGGGGGHGTAGGQSCAAPWQASGAATPHYPPAETQGPVPAPAVAHTSAREIAPAPVASAPWIQQNPQQGRTATQVAQGNGAAATAAPFMHYEDLDYFQPVPEPEPKDELHVDGGVPRADTFPPIPEGMNRPKARRSWDRQRKRRRKKLDPGDGGAGRGREGRCAPFCRYCLQWLPEILCCLLSIACLAAIVGVLKTFDGRGLSDWPLTVSLNTLVAFLTAVCQVALAVPLTTGLSQLKWNSFARGQKPLADFQAFEDAMRGPLGSAMLLWKRKGRCAWPRLPVLPCQ